MEQPWSQTHNLLSFHVYVSPTAKALSPSQSQYEPRQTRDFQSYQHLRMSQLCKKLRYLRYDVE